MMKMSCMQKGSDSHYVNLTLEAVPLGRFYNTGHPIAFMKASVIEIAGRIKAIFQKPF